MEAAPLPDFAQQLGCTFAMQGLSHLGLAAQGVLLALQLMAAIQRLSSSAQSLPGKLRGSCGKLCCS